MKSMKKITSLVGSTALLGGAVVAVPLVSTACGTLNEFSATAEAIQDGPRQSDDRNSTSAVEVTLDGATAEDVLDATWTLKSSNGTPIQCDVVPGSKNSVIRLRIAKPQTWTGETGSVTFSKKSYKCKTESIPVVNLRPDHTKHFKVTATPDNFTHYGVYATESVEIYVEGCTFAELTDDTTFQLYDSNNTLIQTSSFGFNPHSKVLTISLTPPQEYASGTGRIILQNVPAGLTCDDADSIFVQNLIPDTTTHYAILGTTVIDDLINNFTTSIQVQLSKPIAKALLDDQAQFHIMDKTNNPLPIMFSNAVASEDNTTVILTQSDHDRLYPFVDGDGALTIIGSPHYTCTTNTTTITGIHYDETIHYTAIAYPHNNGAVNQNTTSVDIQLTGVTADDIQNENAKFAVQLWDKNSNLISTTTILPGTAPQIIRLEITNTKFAAGDGIVTIDSEGYTCTSNPIPVQGLRSDHTTHFTATAVASASSGDTDDWTDTVTVDVTTLDESDIDLLEDAQFMFTNNFNVSIPCTYPRMVEDTGGVEHLTLTIPTAGYTDIGKLTITSATYTQDNIISIEGLNGDTDIHDYAVSALTDGDQRDPTREITIHLFANSLRWRDLLDNVTFTLSDGSNTTSNFMHYTVDDRTLILYLPGNYEYNSTMTATLTITSTTFTCVSSPITLALW